MKKVFLSLAVIAALTVVSCKQAETAPTEEITTEEVVVAEEAAVVADSAAAVAVDAAEVATDAAATAVEATK